MMIHNATTYDQVPYPSLSYAYTHPDRLATVARLMGMEVTPVEQCRVLELGCAGGGNLFPMAYTLPESEFVGIDSSKRQIDEGLAWLKEVALDNVTLKHMDILDVDDDMGQFDYIVAHGIFSWVPHRVQEKLLQVCKENLAPNGVAFVSYNTYPGWHMIGIVRGLMRYHTRGEADPQQRATRAREILDFFAQASSPEDSAYGSFLRMYAEMLQSGHKVNDRTGNAFLLHDEMEEINQPYYFYEFAERAAEHGLQYLGEAQFRMMMTSNFAPEVTKKLNEYVQSVIDLEQYMDFLRNRTLRQTLLCHQNIELSRRLHPEQIQSFLVSSYAKPETEEPDIQSTTIVKFLGADGSAIAMDHPASKAAMIHLAKAWPARVPFDTLLDEARTHLGLSPGDDDRDRDAQVLAANLFRAFGYSTELAQLHTYCPPMALTVRERPAVSPVARLQAQESALVTNLRHERVTLDDLDRHLIQYLDGSRDQAELVRCLEEGPVADGSLILEDDGERIDDREQLRETLAAGVSKRLRWLQFAALLVG
jgi:methyltransferase-like protein/2-polyprenyl-3-methyl-5-hydroxy-6-metoxy-1,4-benzoquinol methylase